MPEFRNSLWLTTTSITLGRRSHRRQRRNKRRKAKNITTPTVRTTTQKTMITSIKTLITDEVYDNHWRNHLPALRSPQGLSTNLARLKVRYTTNFVGILAPKSNLFCPIISTVIRQNKLLFSALVYIWKYKQGFINLTSHCRFFFEKKLSLVINT